MKTNDENEKNIDKHNPEYEELERIIDKHNPEDEEVERIIDKYNIKMLMSDEFDNRDKVVIIDPNL
jgi:hypothetical protein